MDKKTLIVYIIGCLLGYIIIYMLYVKLGNDALSWKTFGVTLLLWLGQLLIWSWEVLLNKKKWRVNNINLIAYFSSFIFICLLAYIIYFYLLGFSYTSRNFLHVFFLCMIQPIISFWTFFGEKSTT